MHAEPEWKIAEQPWDQRLGNHRARVQVSAAADAVRVRLPWRRHDRDPQNKAVWVVSAATGERVHNVVTITVSREEGHLVFQALQPGEYGVYYMPFVLEGKWFPTTVYDPPAAGADAAWLEKHGLHETGPAAGACQSLPEASVIAFEARTDFDRMDPMELAATEAEVSRLLAASPDAACLLFPEDRRFPIRMAADLPKRWIDRGPSDHFEAEAARNEFYVFQIGLYAGRMDVDGVEIVFHDLRSAAGVKIPAARLRCFNTGGTDWLGRPFAKTVRVNRGHIQALWIGVDVSGELASGLYEGTLTVRPAGGEALPVRLRLAVTDAVLGDRGDSEPWRMSRLRWLDSTIGMEPEVTRPYTPVAVDGATVSCLGRSIRFGEAGLPSGIRVGGAEILEGPIRFVVERGGKPVTWRASGTRVAASDPACAVVDASLAADGVSLTCRATMEFDGYCRFSLVLKADRACELDDVRLEVPLAKAFATYMMGLGCKGGRCPARWDWKWDVRKYQDSLWIGDVNGGFHLKLKGADYRRPLGNIHYHRQPLRLPDAWHNNGRGGCTVEPEGDGVKIRAYSGARRLAAGEELRFDADMLVTPVKPLDLKAHSRQRYYHGGVPEPEQAVEKGATLINLHHANALNPFINYPFLRSAELGAYIKRAHAAGAGVKLYYTIRELTNHLPELWALRSLGDEIYVDGTGGGHAWLHEHLGDHYAPAWHTPFDDGTWCCSISQAGLSRWHNYYLEGLAWLCDNLGIDGLYLDEIGYDREIMKRVRRVLDRRRPGALLDLHSWNHFCEEAGWANCLNLYMEHFPFLDSLWIGESRNYDEGPDYWLVEVSGIPFGLYSEMLEGGGNPWRGMLYGMTTRLPWCGDPTPLWKLWDEFGLGDSEMLGYWAPDCPVRTGDDRVLATVYRRPGRSLICVASWGGEPVNCRLRIDWAALGLDAARVTLRAPAIGTLQVEKPIALDGLLTVEPRGGWMLVAE